MPEYARGDYAGRHTTPHQQRIRIMAAGATPGLPGTGAVLASRKAAQFAPPGQRKRAMARQAAGPIAAIGGLVLGGSAGARAASKSPRLERSIRRGYQVAERHQPKVMRRIRPMKESAKMNPAAIGRAGGMVAGKIVAGGAVTQAAISRNIAAEDRYNRHHRVSKVYNPSMLPTMTSRGTPRKVHKLGPDGAICGLDGAFGRGVGPFGEHDGEVDCGGCLRKMTEVAKLAPPEMTRKQVKGQVRRKRLSATLSTTGGVLGLGAVSLLGAKKPSLVANREKLLAAGAGIGGVNALTSASIQRREAKAEKATISKRAGGVLVSISKASPPLQTTMDDKTAHKLVHGRGGYGTTGPLPRNLDRKTRMDAYQARYIATGGKKSQRLQHVADHANNVGTASVAAATGAGATYLGSESARVKRTMKRPGVAAQIGRHPRLAKITAAGIKRGSERAAVTAGVVGGAAQLVATEAKKRRASYASAPGGVAASNYRRMQAYTPGG